MRVIAHQSKNLVASITEPATRLIGNMIVVETNACVGLIAAAIPILATQLALQRARAPHKLLLPLAISLLEGKRTSPLPFWISGVSRMPLFHGVMIYAPPVNRCIALAPLNSAGFAFPAISPYWL